MSRSRRRTKLRDDEEEDGSASSTKFTETATGWHMLKVESYCQISGLGVARRLKSCPFVVGGHAWCIAYFPNGVTEDTADCISFALRLEDRCAGTGREAVMVRTTFSLLGVAGGPAPSLTVSCGVWTFSRIGQSCCHARFMERKEFEWSYVKDHEFCIIKVRRDSLVGRCAAAGPAPAIRRPPRQRGLGGRDAGRRRRVYLYSIIKRLCFSPNLFFL
jgi:speckle-type POZ protein